MKRIVIFQLFNLLLSLMIISCGKDDEDISLSLVGTWDCAEAEVSCPSVEAECNDWTTFYEDGTWESGTGSDRSHGTYRIDGNTLIITDSNIEESEIKMTFQLTEETLVLTTSFNECVITFTLNKQP